ncbi:MAG: transposase [Deltaproteobacteria bacterium]|nr:transposase [Deltaproteobacteria bacterium]
MLLKTGAATAIQRFDSALALNVHFHALVLDGAYAVDAAGKPQFYAVAAPDDEDVGEVAMRVYRRVAKLFDTDLDAVGVREPAMVAMAAASLRRMVATGSRRGLPIRRLKSGQTPVARFLGKTCAEVEGFNIHTNVRVAANDRVGLEALCRYIARPPLSDDRLQEREDGSLSLRLKRAWSDGTTHLLLSPGELIEKLIPLIPRPRSHTMRYHGVLAPASGWRSAIVPRRQACTGATPKQAPHKGKCCQRIPWAALLMRVFKIDVLACGRCGGRMTVLAAVFNQNAVERILEHLGENSFAPKVAAARAPPSDAADW